MSTVDIEIDGLQDTITAMSGLVPDLYKRVLQATTLSDLAVIGVAKEYPPETEANQPGRINEEGQPLGYYERNKGSWQPIKNEPKGGVTKFGKTVGIIRAKKAQKTQGVYAYKLRATSEQLGKSWSSSIETSPTSIVGVTGTDVSYAIPVMGPANRQSKTMKQIGWRNTDDVLEEVTPDIIAAFDDALTGVKL